MRLNILVGSLFFTGLVCFSVVGYRMYSMHSESITSGNTTCSKQKVINEYFDQQMASLIPEGSDLRVLEDYYRCNPVLRGEWAWFRFSQQVEPVVRIVYGLPGDKFTVEKLAENKWRVLVNGAPVYIGKDQYYFENNNPPPLKTYSESGHGILAKDEYLLFTHDNPGLTDSSNLGIIKASELAGKVTGIVN